MRESFRQAMAFLHTWLGLVLGFVLMATFFFGSLAVFDREIDQWSVPETRMQRATFPSIDRVVLPLVAQVRPSADSLDQAARQVVGPLPPVNLLKPTAFGVYSGHREPLLHIYVEFQLPNVPRDAGVDHVYASGQDLIVPRNGWHLLGGMESRLNLGSGFFFPMHFMLQASWLNIGLWIVGLAALVMMAALVSGVIVHRRLFREFFTFRSNKSQQRAILDLHNMTGVLALPFMFFMTLSGLLIYAQFYLPSNAALMGPLVEAQEQTIAARIPLPGDPAGTPGALASVDAMVEAAKVRWFEEGSAGQVASVAIFHLGDSASYVSIGRDSSDRVLSAEYLHFRASTGELLYEDPPPAAAESVNQFLYGLHYIQFRHWILRWLYFVGGLVGCACIATGFLFFVEKRKKEHVALGSQGVRVVDALAVASVIGMPLAAVAMLLANRVLPVEWPHYNVLQMAVFWFVWLAALIHAGARSRPVALGGVSPAWAEQAFAVAVFGVAAAVANWITTGDNLLKTISAGYWPVAGVDLALLAGALVALTVGLRLSRMRAPAVVHLTHSSAEIGGE